MLRTIVVRNEKLVRNSIKRLPKSGLVRCLSYNCENKLQPQRYSMFFLFILFLRKFI